MAERVLDRDAGVEEVLLGDEAVAQAPPLTPGSPAPSPTREHPSTEIFQTVIILHGGAGEGRISKATLVRPTRRVAYEEALGMSIHGQTRPGLHEARRSQRGRGPLRQLCADLVVNPRRSGRSSWPTTPGMHSSQNEQDSSVPTRSLPRSRVFEPSNSARGLRLHARRLRHTRSGLARTGRWSAWSRGSAHSRANVTFRCPVEASDGAEDLGAGPGLPGSTGRSFRRWPAVASAVCWTFRRLLESQGAIRELDRGLLAQRSSCSTR